jgi:hypothetical protein
MTAGSNGAGVHNAILDAGNDGVGVCDIMTNGRDGCICAHGKFLLEAELATAITRAPERTLKTRRILSRFNLQVAIMSLSSFA